MNIPGNNKSVSGAPAHTNRLIHATSPYLLQHAHNPVDWYEWGDDALSLARKLDLPILVSIGYSSCHWCHVMERESFENESIASVMNANYVCIKVDREERPDVDQIYMEAVQALGVHGGWPLNVVLTSDQKPFFGGTYFTPQAWIQILENVSKAYKSNRDNIEETAEELTNHLMRSDIGRFVNHADSSTVDLKAIAGKLAERFDRRRGGMSNVPKFIMPSIWRFLLRYYHLTDDDVSLDQIRLTLDRIAGGGIYDQLGGGFARYSVDGDWFAPHFEKMLYDNAQLMSLYSEAFSVTRNERYREVVNETLGWLKREMTNAEGGFYSALDADSEGVEGKFYCWQADELDHILGPKSASVKEYYQVSDAGNWEHGMNILHKVTDEKLFLSKHNLSAEEWHRQLSHYKETLLAARASRVRPGLDDKILTAWNAMMTCGLLDAYATLGGEQFKETAAANLRFIQNNLSEGNTLYRSFKEKRSATHGFLDDYAWYIFALTKYYQVTFDETALARAVDFTRAALLQFYDPQERYFFYTSGDAEKLIARKKEIFDNVIPSSNAIMAQNLNWLGTITGNDEWQEMSKALVMPLQTLTSSEPSYMSQWAIALVESQNGLREVVLAGDSHDHHRTLLKTFLPFAAYLKAGNPGLIPLVAGKEPVNGQDTIFVCHNRVCQLPVHDADQAIAQIKA
ncbi:thioredoxin domain-containing protein [Chryseolinea sp. T2]|uniref:thioredoxin domain-containing protein n=1 Tax=Chryseolinea sp. T2 TaxID=3129255 RepID=UPI0030782A03